MSVDALPESLKAPVHDAKVLLVGAGGIGCEVLKNLVLTGFKSIEVIDLDTIDVSNLNRQFLFQRPHVGQSKSRVACSAAQQFCPDVRLVAHHDSVIKPEYGVAFFKEFTVVLNALDNRAARSHVNRMCLAADVPLVESGTAGYLGQVTVIKKGATECYDCQPKSAQKTYPGCTIRNTPSEPIHCIVWAKHLFNQLFGEADPDEDVSPDTADPELAGDAAGANALLASESAVSGDGNVQRQSTRAWAALHGYRVDKLFRKLFHDDIRYLLSMDKLWLKRTPPKPLDYEELTTITLDSPTDSGDGSAESGSGSGLADQRVWSASECCSVLDRAVQQLRQRVGSCDQQPAAAAGEEKQEEVNLTWDKDDAASMDFVAACANLRSHCFGISLNSRFTIKSMAGNIIPAIATTNAIIAGLLVMETFKLLQDRLQDCRTVYLNRKPNLRNCLLVHCTLMKPNPKCYVCADKPEVTVRLDVDTCTIQTLEDRVLKAALHMAAPDAELEDGRGTILISSEPGETDANRIKTLGQLGVRHGTRLKCDDFLQNYELVVNIVHSADMDPGTEFELIGDPSQLAPPSSSDGPQPSTSGQSSTSDVLSAPVHTNGASSHSSKSSDVAATPANSSASTSNGQSKQVDAVVEAVEDEDDLVCLSDDKLEVEPVEAGDPAPVAVSKRPHDDDSSDLLPPAAKRSRVVLPAASSSPSSPQPEVIDL